VSSLNLTDPDADNFRPEGCATFHDIIRFAHEKAMAEMFGISDTSAAKTRKDHPPQAGIPLDAHMIDVGDGLREGVCKVGPEDIHSVPFAAFLKGLCGMRWPEPRQVDAGDSWR